MSHFLTTIAPAFASQRYEVKLVNANVCQISDSNDLPLSIAVKIISSANYCPIFSQNRLDENLEFTVVPYVKPKRFDKIVCKTREISQKELWNMIESTPSIVVENGPITVHGKKMFNSLAEGERELAQSCNKTASLLVDFIDQVPRGIALDLGCGQGVNTIQLLKRGWKVIAIDKSSDVLEACKSTMNHIDTHLLTTNQLSLVHDDITRCEWERDSLDLVVCIDVLPYISPKKLNTLVHKIHDSLTPKGCFVGTLFYSLPSNSNIEETLGKLGAYFYKEEHAIPAFLRYSGFTIRECNIRQSCIVQGGTVEFIAQKI